jgi:hypothetical protein
MEDGVITLENPCKLEEISDVIKGFPRIKVQALMGGLQNSSFTYLIWLVHIYLLWWRKPEFMAKFSD